MTTTRDGPGGGVGAAELFTVEQLAEISQNQDPVANDLAGDRVALVPEMIKGGIATKNQITAFLANICQETDHLNTLEEYGDEDYYRSFLGDEWMYHGRGYIMNTWLEGYQRLSSVLGVDLVSNPDLLAQDKDLAAKAAVWYWNDVGCGPYAEQEDFEAVCSLINRGEAMPLGPINGWEERLAAYERAKSVIGTGTEPVTEPAREGSESVADRITLRYDQQGWAYDTASGLPVKSNTAELVHKTNKDGWLWADVATGATTVETTTETITTTVSTWSWPEAWDEPWPGSEIYQERHPTRYVWRPDVEKQARWLVDTFNVSCNSYYEHPEGRGFEVASTDPDGTVWYIMNTSFDVWGPAGRNDPIGSTVGWQIFNLLMNDPNPPNVRWIIWQRNQYGEWNGWQGEPFEPGNEFMAHEDHIHVTYW